MSPAPFALDSTEVVTFDCWSTLVFESNPHAPLAHRLHSLESAAAAAGVRASSAQCRRAFETAWLRHYASWTEGRATGSPEIAAWALAELGVRDAEAALELAARFAAASSVGEVVPLLGARHTLVRMRAEGLRIALICDTGFASGSIVRELLDGLGILELLEVTTFSDEVGAAKPEAQPFRETLSALGVPASAALHVGDLKRTDVAGARGVGMASVRLRDHHDDAADLPDADHLADSHQHLLELFGLA